MAGWLGGAAAVLACLSSRLDSAASWPPLTGLQRATASGPPPAWPWAMLALLGLKIGLEPAGLLSSVWSFAVYWPAHAAGLAGGLLVACLMRAWARWASPPRRARYLGRRDARAACLAIVVGQWRTQSAVAQARERLAIVGQPVDAESATRCAQRGAGATVGIGRQVTAPGVSLDRDHALAIGGLAQRPVRDLAVVVASGRDHDRAPGPDPIDRFLEGVAATALGRHAQVDHPRGIGIERRCAHRIGQGGQFQSGRPVDPRDDIGQVAAAFAKHAHRQ
ncbi:MAG: hypothetical protein RLZZ22_472 [Pseudomonadota bacterium]